MKDYQLNQMGAQLQKVSRSFDRLPRSYDQVNDFAAFKYEVQGLNYMIDVLEVEERQYKETQMQRVAEAVKERYIS